MKIPSEFVKVPLVVPLVAVLSVGLTLLGVRIANATVTTTATGGQVSTFEYVEATGSDPGGCFDNDDTFHDVPGLTRTFNQGGAKGDEPVLIDVSILVGAGVHGSPVMRVLVDNVPLSGRGAGMELIPEQASRMYRFVSDDLTRGSHTVKVQVKNTTVSDTNCVDYSTYPSLTIFHK